MFKTGGAVKVCASKTIGGQVGSTTGVAAATSSEGACNARKTDDLGELEGEVSQPDTLGKPPLTPSKAQALNPYP